LLLFKIGIILYFVYNILDCVDGNIARIKKNPTFYGRFIDAFFGIIIGSLIIFGTSIFCKNFLENNNLYLLGLITTIIYPFGQFIFDKYSALARWQNDETRKKIKPYIWKESVSKYFIFLKDLPIFLFLSLLFISNLKLIEIILFLYFMLNIFFDIYLIILHIYKSSKNMKVTAKNHR
jgi:phosphatidylglycerophosphate synthase